MCVTAEHSLPLQPESNFPVASNPEMPIKLPESQGDALGGFNIPERTAGKAVQRAPSDGENKRMICCRGGKSSGGLRD